MATSGFAYRLAYVRWLRQRGRVDFETDRELAAALGVGVPWFTKWKRRPDAPDGRTEIRALMASLGPLGVREEWLLDGQGEAPEPDLWRWWSHAPDKTATHPRAKQGRGQPTVDPRSESHRKRGNDR